MNKPNEAHVALSRLAAGEGMVLLKNEGNALPLKKGVKIALFGKSSVAYIKGGGGSGDVHCEYVRNIYDGFEIKQQEEKVQINADVYAYYKDFIFRESIKGRELIGGNAAAEPVLPAELVENAAKESDIAIVTIGRFSWEGGDRKEENDFYLTKEENELIQAVTSAFSKTVLVLDVGGMVDSSYFIDNPKIPAVLLAWQAGIEGGLAIADILCGDVNPSGKLVDTFAKTFADYPSSEHFDDSDVYVEYFEDIYVGYRYFETVPGAAEKVNYPFGYGLSYTTFAMSDISVREENGKINAEVTVTNTGDYAGKQVVQLYYSAPQGILGKPAKELAAFAKTKLLECGEAQKLTLSFAVSDMASYDDLGKIAKAAYVLEKGEYSFHIGSSVRDTVKADFVYTVIENTVTEQLVNRCTPCQLSRRMLSDGTYEELPLKDVIFNYEPNEPITAKAPENIVKFENMSNIDEFIAQFTDDELCEFMGGDPNIGVSNTSCFSGLERLGVQPVPTADGPAGVRIDWHHEVSVTAWPCGTLLACTWNTELVEMIGKAGGEEMRENNLKVWLTPALNIHRTPLCGRNFEYFSEDPLVAGKMAAAKVRGMQSEKVACSIKHFACNNRENNRFINDSRVSERALREIYLKGFEICVKEADPWTVMTSYNLLNGIHTSESYDLIMGILRGEWGFKGMITTDWGVKNDPVREVKAGNDMKMHAGYPDDLKEALKNGTLERADLEACAKRILTVYKRLY